MATSVLRTLALRLRLNSAQFQKDIGKVDKRMKKLSGSMRRSANMFNSQLGQLGATFATGFGLAELTNAADTMVNLRNKMNATYETSQEVAQGMLDIKRIARESRADLDAVGTLYQRISVSTKNMGATQEEVAAVTQVVSNSFLMSGTTASEAANSARQFAQGLASGTLRGDEFRSVSENNVVLTKMLAEGLNLTVGELRLFAQEGGLTAERILPILTGQLEFTNEAIKDMRLNISQSRTLFKNSFTEMVDRVNSVFKVTDKTALVIKALSDNIHTVTLAAAAFATILMTRVLIGMAAWTAMTVANAVAMTFSLIPAMVSVMTVMGHFANAIIGKFMVKYGAMMAMVALNPFTLTVAAVVALGVAFVALEQKFKFVDKMQKGLARFGDLGAAIFDNMKIGFARTITQSKLFFSGLRDKAAEFFAAVGLDDLAKKTSSGGNTKKLKKELAALDKTSLILRARIQKAADNINTITVDPNKPGAFTNIIESATSSIKDLFKSDTPEEGGMFGGMVEGFSAGVDGILNKIMESNPTLAKFWATLKGQNDPDLAAAEGGASTSMDDMSWTDRWIAAIAKIKDAFKSMGASESATITKMIEKYDTFEEVLNRGIKTLKKNSHIRKGIMMREALIAGKKAVMDAYATGGPFPFNLGAAALVAANTAIVMRDIMKGQAHDGMDSLPSTGTYMLERGERVVSSRANRDLTEYLAQNKNGSSSSGPQSVTLQVNGISDPDMVVSALASRRGELEAMMRSISQENTRLSPF